MVLYVVRPDNPAPGVEWLVTVPGQYIYEITGITATLTPAAGPVTIARDVSGNGRDGTYQGHVPRFVAGLIPGDTALYAGAGPPIGTTIVSCPSPNVDFLHNWSVAWWGAAPIGSGGLGPQWVTGPNASEGQISVTSQSGTPGFNTVVVSIFTSGGPDDWETGNAFADNGLAHFFVLTWNGTVLRLYVDNVLTPWAVTGFKPLVPVAQTAFWIVDLSFVGGAGNNVIDEFATFASVLTAGNVNTLYAARGAFAGYTTAVLGFAPTEYYHLDDVSVGTGRQVTLEVTDGTNVVDTIPSGFAETTTPGPYAYSWQPKLQSSTQSPDGTTTTVAIPKLLIPAGYTVGSRTLDLSGADRWSAVTIWWDSAYMDSIGPDAFDYPPGARLRYKQIVN